MQNRSDHRNRGTGTSEPAVASEEAGWRRDERLSLFVFVGVLCAGVLVGALFWKSGTFGEGRTGLTVVHSEPDTFEKLSASASRSPRAVGDAPIAEVPLPVGQFDGQDPNLDRPRATANGRAHLNTAGNGQTTTDQPSPTRLQIAQAVEPQSATDAGVEAGPETTLAQADETVLADEGSRESGAPEPAWVAGVEPDQRPAGAPVIRQMTKESDWYSWALTGTSRPYPESFKFLEDQEAWYTPFSRPGMTGPYDLRGWHRLEVPAEGS